MEKYDSIVKRVDEIEYKYGISYAAPDGRLFKGLLRGFTLLFAYTMAIHLIILLGYIGSGQGVGMLVSLILINAAMIAGFVFLRTKLKIAGMAASFAAAVYAIVYFAPFFADISGFAGYRLSYYWRHFIPLALMAAFLIGMFIIALRYRLIKRYAYNKLVENLYAEYHAKWNDLTDEEWNYFLKTYDPRESRKKEKIDE